MALEQVLRKQFRYVSIFLHFVVIIFCSCVFFPLGSVTNYFQSQCLLFADPVLTLNSNFTATVDIARSIWGSVNLCNVCIYVPVVTAIHSFIWCWFYLQMWTMNDELRMLCSLLISAILQVILFVTQLVSSIILSLGFFTFCHHLTHQLGDKYNCSEAQTWNWDIFDRKHKFHTFLTVAVVFSWLVTAILFLLSLLSGHFSYKAVNHSFTTGSQHPSHQEFSYSNPQKMSYSELSVDDDTGSVMFDVELSHNSMKEQYEKL
ncbi:uncharacterized protein LOC110463516 [Mizuhopecten yessoensis]|uniref:uncharacterized protein LOC110463516 n=1 Tax=Mizuhopecten yessoensis TaxID=6573 RepID=UPI000B45A78B|nr:uncharacterized protein LOC110463516 [Mizuhopecten yessoensis]